MSLILNIDTTSEMALVNIAKDGAVLYEKKSDDQKNHAAFLHPAIIEALKKNGLTINDIDAIAVSHGPGSYTGIRVGLAAAKGLCYASNKPLITINQLEILAKDAIDNRDDKAALYCPMIDARRMEVFAAVYDHHIKEQMPPSAVILHQHSFDNFLHGRNVYFFGSGAAKWQQLCTHENAFYPGIVNKGLAFAALSFEMQKKQAFENLYYAAALYIKDFHTTAGA